MEDELLTLLDCEKRTGRKVSTWRMDIFRRRVKYVKIGRLVRIPSSEIKRLIEDGTHEVVSK